MSYAAILESVTPAAQHLVAHGGHLEYRAMYDDAATIRVSAEGGAYRLRVWDRVALRVRDDVVDAAEVGFRFACEIHFAQIARLN